MTTVLPARDAPVHPMEETEIAGLAARLRSLCRVSPVERLDIGIVLDWLTQNSLPEKGKLEIVECNPDQNHYKAVVTFDPLRLKIFKTTLLHGRLGNPLSKYIIAHEIGHMVFHNRYAKPFSVNPVAPTIFMNKSAEWQANKFADHFLFPDHILMEMVSIDGAIKRCGITRELAEARWPLRNRLLKVNRSYAGDQCPECQSFTLVEKGIRMKCDTCGVLTIQDLL